MSRVFEGSGRGPLPADAVLECGVCWWVYDPALGDEIGDIAPGVGFSSLPEHWRCPSCDNDKSKFMLREPAARSVAGAAPPPADTSQDARVGALLAAYRAAEGGIVGLPIHNPRLDIEAVGFRPHEAGYAGVVITPWSMNLVLLAADPAAPLPGPLGSTRAVGFPSGVYSFLCGRIESVGRVETCSLFSPMDDFSSQEAARAAAAAAVEGLFTPPEPEPPKAVSRRFLFTRSAAGV